LRREAGGTHKVGLVFFVAMWSWWVRKGRTGKYKVIEVEMLGFLVLYASLKRIFGEMAGMV
jgi:hypothetical protein